MTDRSAPNLCEWCCHPAVPGHDLHTAWLIRTDRGVRDQYERWLRS